MISIEVPARICFFGDHQDYLGLPVIAGTIDRYIKLMAYPISQPEFQLNLLDIGESRVLPLTVQKGKVPQKDYLLSAMAVLQNEGFVFKKGYRIEISGNIPVNAGLSSSSALTVAWIRFLTAVQNPAVAISDTKIGHWAYQAEVEFFNGPGGLMDQYTIAQQGLLFIDTKNAQTERLLGHLGKLVVAESGISKRTQEVLKNGRTYQEKAVEQIKMEHPDFEMQNATLKDYDRFLNVVTENFRGHWYAAIHNFEITKKAYELLRNGICDIPKLGELMNAHQQILQDKIGNTPKEMVVMLEAARKAGALGAKTIGSGGGGCMVAMVSNKTKENVIKAFMDNGAKDAYEVELTAPKK